MTSPSPDTSPLAEQVELLRKRVLQLEAQNTARASRVAGVKKGLLAAVVVLVVSNVAWAQLKTFVANTPALAGDVNSNFTQLKTWLEQKVGTAGTPDVTVTGRLTTPSASINGPIYRGSTVPATGDLGLYSEVTSNWIRFVSTAGDFHFYTDGAAGNGYAGTTTAFEIQTNGTALVRGDLTVLGNTSSGAWLSAVNKSPSDGNAVGAGGTPNSGWASSECANGQYVCGIAFTHPFGQNGTNSENFVIRCCGL